MGTLLLPILVPVFMGMLLFILPEPKNRKTLLFYTGAVLVLNGILIMRAVIMSHKSVTLFSLHEQLSIVLKADEIGKIFAVVTTIIWICAGFFAFSYMSHDKHEKRYYAFYLIVFGVLIGLDFSGNIITMYAFYEFMTLCSFPLVIHNQSREAIMAAMKYLLYSFFGAYMALFGIYFMITWAAASAFVPGGTMNIGQNQSFPLFVVFLMLLGFGVKAGMFPVHGWLPTAHPVAPGPASAVLSAIIVKSGVLAMIRVVYYVVGAEFILGTWVQTVWLSLALITVFMGSMLAYGEKVLKKRLAYSTVSQVSYIVFGIALLQPVGVTGSLLHVLAHAFIKCTLFLVAAAIIYQTGCTRVDELCGIGKKMPVTMWCYTFASLGLIGIPPTGGFISKWYLATGALDSNLKVFRIAGPIVLLISALLTAGYLLPISINAFLPGEELKNKDWKKCEPDKYMLLPCLVLTVLSVLMGIFPDVLIRYFTGIVSKLM